MPELPTNPFIDENLQTTVYNAVNAIAVLELAIADSRDTGERMSFSLEQYIGMLRILAGIRATLNHVAARVEELETQHCHELRDISADFAGLSADQRELIRDLISDIANEAISPVSVATKDAARIALAGFEAETAKLSAEECAKDLEARDFDVHLAMTSPRGVDLFPGKPGYVLTQHWTLKGLRFALARERFLETITCNT